jgi:hypothetical protein
MAGRKPKLTQQNRIACSLVLRGRGQLDKATEVYDVKERFFRDLRACLIRMPAPHPDLDFL